MSDIIIINTGGTFNKKYNRFSGEQEIVKNNIEDIIELWLANFKVMDLINKDSLEFTDHDRNFLKNSINSLEYKKVIIVHGTDTIQLSADMFEDTDKIIVFTGAMVPYNSEKVEAVANLASAIGFLEATNKSGVYISMNGIFGTYDEIKKDKDKGKFVKVKK